MLHQCLKVPCAIVELSEYLMYQSCSRVTLLDAELIMASFCEYKLLLMLGSVLEMHHLCIKRAFSKGLLR